MVCYMLSLEWALRRVWNSGASLSKNLRKQVFIIKNYVLRFCFFAAGNKMLLRMSRYPGEFG
jgi:hypothetical protein